MTCGHLLPEAFFFDSEGAIPIILKYCQQDPEYFRSEPPILQLAALIGEDEFLTELLNAGVGPEAKSEDGDYASAFSLAECLGRVRGDFIVTVCLRTAS